MCHDRKSTVLNCDRKCIWRTTVRKKNLMTFAPLCLLILLMLSITLFYMIDHLLPFLHSFFQAEIKVSNPFKSQGSYILIRLGNLWYRTLGWFSDWFFCKINCVTSMHLCIMIYGANIFDKIVQKLEEPCLYQKGFLTFPACF